MHRRMSRRELELEVERYRRAWQAALDQLLYVHGDTYGRALPAKETNCPNQYLGEFKDLPWLPDGVYTIKVAGRNQ